MTFEEIKQGEETYIMHTYGRFPLRWITEKAQRCGIRTEEKYIDLTSGIGVNSLGHDNEALTTAVSEQAHKLMHACNLYYTEPDGAGSKEVGRCSRNGKNLFCKLRCGSQRGHDQAGRESIPSDKYGEGRNKIITLKQSFHGRTVTTLKATGQDKFHQYFFPFTEGFDYAAANDIDRHEAAQIDDTTCAVMMEMIQGEGGVLPLDKEFVQATAEILQGEGHPASD